MGTYSDNNSYLSNAVKTLSIETNGIRGLINSISSNFNIRGSIYNYSSNRGYRDINLSNNFEHGSLGRYGYTDGEFEEGYNVWDKISARYPVLNVPIGLPYEKYDNLGNGEEIIRTKEELSAFETIFRDENIINGRSSYGFLEDNGKTKVIMGTPQSVIDRGGLYDVKDNDLGEEKSNLEGYQKKYKNGFSSKIAENGLFEASEDLRLDSLYNNLSHGKYGSYKYPLYGTGGATYGNIFPSQAITSPGSLITGAYEVSDDSVLAERHYLDEDGDIYDRQTEYRDKNIAILSTRIGGGYDDFYASDIPSSVSLNGKVSINDDVYSSYGVNTITLDYDSLFGLSAEYREYGIGLNQYNPTWENGYQYGFRYDLYKRYESNEKNTFVSAYTVDDSFTKGQLRTYNYKKETNGYNLYNEIDGEEVPTSVKTDALSEDAISLGSFDSSSNILKRTNELYRKGVIKTLVNRFHTDAITSPNEFETSISEYGMSRGRNLLKEDRKNDKDTGYGDPYCRVWTSYYQYAKYNKAIRHVGPASYSEKAGDSLRPNKTWSNYSVLGANGLPEIAPKEDTRDLKKYMFSIENLAWKDMPKETLSKEQQGPNGGRIMWFPPYNLKFSENISTDWNPNSFIGRGEDIHTYTKTSREGTLNFTILVDHPSIINKWRGQGELEDKISAQQELLRYFAGCSMLEPTNDKDTTKKEVGKAEAETPSVTPVYEGKPIDIAYVMFFPNDFSAYDCEYVSGATTEIDPYEDGDISTTFSQNDAKTSSTRDESFENEVLKSWNLKDSADYGLNKDEGVVKNFSKIVSTLFDSNIESGDLRTYVDLKNLASVYDGNTLFSADTTYYEIKSIDVQGFASSHGYEEKNKILTQRRRGLIERIIKEYGKNFVRNDMFNEVDGRIIEVADVDGKEDVSSLEAKIARSAIAIFHLDLKDGNNIQSETIDGNYYCYYSGNTTLYSAILYNSGNTYSNQTLYYRNGDMVSFKPYNNNPITITCNNDNSITFQSVGTTSSLTLKRSEESDYIVNGVTGENLATSADTSDEGDEVQNEATIVTTSDGVYTYDNEYLYFQTIKEENDLVYKNITDKIKFFDPAFHSITPEGFNARLTFLNQCSRQGPTVSVNGGNAQHYDETTENELKSNNYQWSTEKVTEHNKTANYIGTAGNLAFGRPPYCILRIGDFYHSKICIKSISINYDNDGIKWDLNPEGIGIQPMMADVSMNFTFVGGQELTKPVERLQNAVTANYYANAMVYDRNSDTSTTYFNPIDGSTVTK